MLFVRGAVGVLFVRGAVGVLFVGGAVGVARSLVIAVLPGPHLPQGCIRASKVALGFLTQKVACRTLSVPSPSGCANTKGGAGRVMAEVVPLQWTAPLLFGMTCVSVPRVQDRLHGDCDAKLGRALRTQH